MIPLPYADDIRDLKFEPITLASNEQINKAKRLVKTLRIKFDSRNFENPGNHHFRITHSDSNQLFKSTMQVYKL